MMKRLFSIFFLMAMSGWAWGVSCNQYKMEVTTITLLDGAPVGGGGGASVYPDIQMSADDFYTPYSALLDTASVSYFEQGVTFDGMVSSVCSRMGIFPRGPSVNYLMSKEYIVPRSWPATATNIYLILSGTGTVTSGTAYMHVILTTCPASLATMGQCEVVESSDTMAGGNGEDIPFTLSTVSNAILKAGTKFWVIIRRVAVAGDCPQTVLFKSGNFSKH